MPIEGVELTPNNNLLTTSEILRLVRNYTYIYIYTHTQRDMILKR